jgi:hypothetical protein
MVLGPDVWSQEAQIQHDPHQHTRRDKPGDRCTVAEEQIAKCLIVGIEREHFGAVGRAAVAGQHIDDVKRIFPPALSRLSCITLEDH